MARVFRAHIIDQDVGWRVTISVVRTSASAAALKLEIQGATIAQFSLVFCASGPGGLRPILARAHVRHARIVSPISIGFQMIAAVARRALRILMGLAILSYRTGAIRTAANILYARPLWIVSIPYFQMVSFETRIASSADVVDIAYWRTVGHHNPIIAEAMIRNAARCDQVIPVITTDTRVGVMMIARGI
jgi:hypothetical protein